MIARLKRLFRMRKPVVDKLAPVQPRVTPDPVQVAQLARRFSELAYEPANGFHRDQRQRKANVVQLSVRRRIR